MKRQDKDKDKPDHNINFHTSYGWVKIHRQIMNSKYYFTEKFTKSSAWFDLIILANFQHSYMEHRGIGINIERGQLGYSQVKLAQRWKWSVNKVKRFLRALKIDGQIDYQNSNVTTLITIQNYDHYQNMDGQTNDQTATKRQPNERHNKNDKKEKGNFSQNIIEKEPKLGAR